MMRIETINYICMYKLHNSFESKPERIRMENIKWNEDRIIESGEYFVYEAKQDMHTDVHRHSGGDCWTYSPSFFLLFSLFFSL